MAASACKYHCDPFTPAKLVSLFWRFAFVYDAIECIICCSCGVNVVVSIECFLFFCACLWNVGGVGGGVVSSDSIFEDCMTNQPSFSQVS